mmetsp:Transcript_3978/g.7937  ORF Transcript_3978/g.7937 Transcript_3978/m.7937 type:complete len:899 (-) Transcript_3978:21-2717(-)
MKTSNSLLFPVQAVVLLFLVLACLAAAAEEGEGTNGGERELLNEEEVTLDGEDYGEEHEEEVEAAHAVLLPWFVQGVGIATYYMLSRYLHGVPYTAVLFVVGVFMGAGAARAGLQDQLTDSIGLWQSIGQETLFTVFLPGLLFKDAIEINFHLFQASFAQLFLLAFPMVLAGACLTALVAKFVFPYEWTFHLCMTFGSILAATDPVAVSALLNEVGAPPRLKMHISGESLLNDGSAVVFYAVFSDLFLYDLDIGLGQYYTVGEGFVAFFKMSLGAVSVGIAYALALIFILRYLDRQYDHEETVLQVTASVTVAYLSFYTSEVVLHMSGVIAVVTAGIVTKAFGGALINNWHVMDSFWILLEHLLNTVLFALGGIVFGQIIADEEYGWTGRDWGYLVVLYVFLNLIRFGLMFAFFPVISKIGIGTNWKEAVFSSFGGLRGAVGIALAIGLDNQVRGATTDTEKRDLTSHVFGMVGGIAFMTLVINGTLSGPLLKKLRIGKTSESRERILENVEDSIRRRLLDDLVHLMTDPRFYYVDFNLVRDHIPRLRDLSAEDLGKAVEQNRESVHPSKYKPPFLDHVLPYIPHSESLKQETEKLKRQVFMTCKISNLDLEILDEEAESGEPSPAILKDMRLLFVELLRAAYNAQISYGELDPREYEGFLAYSLLQSIEFAHDAACSGNPVEDWNLCAVVSTDYVDKTRDIFLRIYGSFFLGRSSSSGKEGHNAHPSHDMPTSLKDTHVLESQRLRLSVLRAFSFLDAHKEAEERLRDKFEDAHEPEIRNAFLAVLRESAKQVKLAEEVLQSKTKKQLKQVISHYLCITLQNKTARYIGVLVESGVLLAGEARELLEEINHSIIELRRCPLAEHPGAIVIEENEEAGGDPTAPGVRRRKRTKQKSLL